jgi:hypothetical protein
LSQFTKDFSEKVKSIPGIVDVDISVKPGLTAYRVKLDDLAMRELGLNSGHVAQSLRAYVNGEVATTWLAGDGEQVQVVLRLPETDRQHLAQMNKLPVAYTKDGQAIELARVANIPPYMVGIGTTGMTYNNAQQARQDLYLFGAKPFMDCIQETLSMNSILARGRHVKFDLESYLSDSEIMPDIEVEPLARNAPYAPEEEQVPS